MITRQDPASHECTPGLCQSRGITPPFKGLLAQRLLLGSMNQKQASFFFHAIAVDHMSLQGCYCTLFTHERKDK